MRHILFVQIIVVICSTVMLGIAIYLLSTFKKLFSGIRNIWLRRNLAVLVVALFFMSAFLALQWPELMNKPGNKAGMAALIAKQLGQIVLIVLFVFNVVWVVSRTKAVRAMSFRKHHAVVVTSIVLSALVIYTIINYIDNGMKFQNLHATLIFAYYNALVTGLIYTAVNYAELERQRKLNEKELEVTRLMALKTKAELDALHSKVNPHFLYNALNSIADLSITDGRKARQMTIALADLFRYSINYSNNNFSTVQDEVEMANVYLQIEKIRFEDKLNYSLEVEESLNHYLVPRFLLQPLVENAVKHGLKATGQMTDIRLTVSRTEKGMVVRIADTGPQFPAELNPGYGVKSVYDKLDLLFPDNYDMYFSNKPIKEVSLYINKLVKDESAI